jgi:hypothetical protein
MPDKNAHRLVAVLAKLSYPTTLPNKLIEKREKNECTIFLDKKRKFVNVVENDKNVILSSKLPNQQRHKIATWVFGPVVILLPKKLYPSMRVWVRSTGSSKYTCV